MHDWMQSAAELQEELTRVRRHFHQNPEPGFAEKDTASYICEYLDALGLYSFSVRSVSRLLDVNKHANQIELEGWQADDLPAAWLCQEGQCQGPMYSVDEVGTSLQKGVG